MRLNFALLLTLSLAACSDGPDAPEPLPAPQLDVRVDQAALTDLATEAVAAVPAWLQDDLAIAFDRLDDEDLSNELARLIVDEGDPYLVDEIAFGIAHSSPEALAANSFHPELLTLNAQLIYAYDAELDYVELVEVGEPGDPDYYTTATYRVGQEDGSVVERTIDRDTYYWYVAHPRLEDELPQYLDAWVSASPRDPDTGMFWREFLWDRAADDCPVGRDCPLLSDLLTVSDVLWKGKAETRDDNGVIGQITQYVWDALDFGAGDERPVQPSRIYTVGVGNCGEHADMTAAAARTGLVPVRNVGARSNDHTWNEFWDERWIELEPIGTHVDYTGYYKGGIARDRMDDDCDGLADDQLDSEDQDGDGVALDAGDCDDTNADIHPSASEVQNGRDDDCDGVADEGFDARLWDADGDGYTVDSGDCDERDADRYPGAPETGNGRDDDCDGVADNGSGGEDRDGDGVTVEDGDCDDTDANVFPGAEERLNDRDDSCDGVADEGLADATSWDRDADGFTIAEGDCHEDNASRYPGAPEIGNGVDDDCDGVADNGVEADRDGDGVSVIGGDCDDTDAAVLPGAEEAPNGVDDNCDGVPDEGLDSLDLDRDGYALGAEDCHDGKVNFHPGADDPRLGTNRLYVMTAARGDTFLDTTLTDRYVTLPSYLEFAVSDAEGRPVDGAVVTIYGTWAVYGAPESWAWAAELVTGLDGRASTTVGEYNPYGYSVSSPAGDEPGEGYLNIAVEQTLPHESYSVEVTTPGSMPAALPVDQVDAPEGGDRVRLVYQVEVEGHRLQADGSYIGSFSVARDGGRLDVFVVDEDNYDAFKGDEVFEAVALDLGAATVQGDVEVPNDRDWMLVLDNQQTVSSVMVGSVHVEPQGVGDQELEGAAPLDRRFRIPPGKRLAIRMRP